MSDPNHATPFDGKAFCENLTPRSGVYRMLDRSGKVIYIGKARNLKKRVASYFMQRASDSPKIRSMVSQIAGIEVTATHTENEALILENNLIKELRPRYNIVLRDDKSYPYIHLTGDHEFPRLTFHRGGRTGKGRYFGPYPSAGAVRASLNLLQKLFLIRPCEDSFFRNRTRPCLQYQIQRCSAPCVGMIDAQSYREDVDHAVMFLEGRNLEVIDKLVRRMEEASGQLNFERAAHYRDQIHQLQRIQQQQYITASGAVDIDVIACASREETGCVQIFYIRKGHNLGNKTFFPAHTQGADPADILDAFLPQYYLGGRADRSIPSEIFVNQPLRDAQLLTDELTRLVGRRVAIHQHVRGERARWLEMAAQNAELALTQRLSSSASQRHRIEALRGALGLDQPIERIECFDISHTQGEATVASCVVFGPEGAIKSDYRRFNIAGIQGGDDYAAMQQALTRRYQRVKTEQGRLPDVLLIDGGKGQVEQARKVLESLQIEDIHLVGVAKGPSRKPGLETLIVYNHAQPIHLAHDSLALHLIQQVRDEAHRFAITGHRKQRAKTRNTSPLEQIEGVGAARRRVLMQHFGGLQGISRAGVEDLSQVPGISGQLAHRIYNFFHDSP